MSVPDVASRASTRYRPCVLVAIVRASIIDVASLEERSGDAITGGRERVHFPDRRLGSSPERQVLSSGRSWSGRAFRLRSRGGSGACTPLYGWLRRGAVGPRRRSSDVQLSVHGRTPQGAGSSCGARGGVPWGDPERGPAAGGAELEALYRGKINGRSDRDPAR